jgi:hypothetical protein
LILKSKLEGLAWHQENELMLQYLEAILKRQKKDSLIAVDKLPPVPEVRDASEKQPANAS